MTVCFIAVAPPVEWRRSEVERAPFCVNGKSFPVRLPELCAETNVFSQTFRENIALGALRPRVAAPNKKRNSADLAATRESVVREFLNPF